MTDKERSSRSNHPGEQADPVAVRHAGAQMSKGIGEAERGIGLEQQVGDAERWQPKVQVKYQLLDPAGGPAVRRSIRNVPSSM